MSPVSRVLFVPLLFWPGGEQLLLFVPILGDKIMFELKDILSF